MGIKLHPLHKKLVLSIHELSNEGYLATDDGLLMFLSGKSKEGKTARSYGTAISLTSKKGKAALRTLLHNGYIKRRYVKEEDGYYYLLTPLGENLLPMCQKLSLRKKEKKLTKSPSPFITIKKEAK